MNRKQPKLIYVTGLAYSGTTLFSSALGQSDNVFNAGEVNYLENDYHPGKLCSCGQKVDDCDVWRRIIARVRKDSRKPKKTLTFSREQTLREIDQRSKPIKTRVLTLFGVRPEWLFNASELEDYASRHRHFIHTIASSVGVDFVVDASKNFTRLQVLQRYTDIPVHVIYLRRALLQSYASRLKRAKRRNRLYFQIFAPLYLTLLFFRVRDLQRQLETLNAKGVSVIDYEQFVENPRLVETQLGKQLGVSVDFGIEKGEFSLDRLHVFTGNVWLSRAAKVEKKVEVRPNDNTSTLSWFEKQTFRVLSPIVNRAQ